MNADRVSRRSRDAIGNGWRLAGSHSRRDILMWMCVEMKYTRESVEEGTRSLRRRITRRASTVVGVYEANVG